jgi:hypothetical protein
MNEDDEVYVGLDNEVDDMWPALVKDVDGRGLVGCRNGREEWKSAGTRFGEDGSDWACSVCSPPAMGGDGCGEKGKSAVVMNGNMLPTVPAVKILPQTSSSHPLGLSITVSAFTTPPTKLSKSTFPPKFGAPEIPLTAVADRSSNR